MLAPLAAGPWPATPAPPAPTVIVSTVPEVRLIADPFNKPPAPPPPAASLPPPEVPPPPATTSYSTVDVTGSNQVIEPLVVHLYTLYPPATVTIGEPVVALAAAYVFA